MSTEKEPKHCRKLAARQSNQEEEEGGRKWAIKIDQSKHLSTNHQSGANQAWLLLLITSCWWCCCCLSRIQLVSSNPLAGYHQQQAALGGTQLPFVWAPPAAAGAYQVAPAEQFASGAQLAMAAPSYLMQFPFAGVAGFSPLMALDGPSRRSLLAAGHQSNNNNHKSSPSSGFGRHLARGGGARDNSDSEPSDEQKALGDIPLSFIEPDPPSSITERISESFSALGEGFKNHFRSISENFSDTVDDIKDAWRPAPANDNNKRRG